MTTTQADRSDRKVREGIVVSDKMDKTITVEVSNRVKHGMYSKVMSRSSKLKAHDEEADGNNNDKVGNHDEGIKKEGVHGLIIGSPQAG